MTADDLQREFRRLLYAIRASQCLHAAAELDLAERLAAAPQTAGELAAATGSHEGALARLLRALCGLGLLRVDAGGRFAVTPLGELLRDGVSGSLRAETLSTLHPTSAAPWGRLADSVRRGQPAFPAIFGTDVWSYRRAHPEAGAVFDTWAAQNAQRQSEALLDCLPVAAARLVVDVGGGTGDLLARLLAARPGLRGILLELPRVAAAAERALRAAGVGERCAIVAGDFFHEIPAGGDLYLVKAVLHNWSDEAGAAILRSCRRAMAPGARLVVVESVLAPTEPWRDHFLDLHMLLMHGGRERTADEMRALFACAGFSLDAITDTPVGLSLLEGHPT